MCVARRRRRGAVPSPWRSACRGRRWPMGVSVVLRVWQVRMSAGSMAEVRAAVWGACVHSGAGGGLKDRSFGGGLGVQARRWQPKATWVSHVATDDARSSGRGVVSRFCGWTVPLGPESFWFFPRLPAMVARVCGRRGGDTTVLMNCESFFFIPAGRWMRAVSLAWPALDGLLSCACFAPPPLAMVPFVVGAFCCGMFVLPGWVPAVSPRARAPARCIPPRWRLMQLSHRTPCPAAGTGGEDRKNGDSPVGCSDPALVSGCSPFLSPFIFASLSFWFRLILVALWFSPLLFSLWFRGAANPRVAGGGCQIGCLPLCGQPFDRSVFSHRPCAVVQLPSETKRPFYTCDPIVPPCVNCRGLVPNQFCWFGPLFCGARQGGLQLDATFFFLFLFFFPPFLFFWGGRSFPPAHPLSLSAPPVSLLFPPPFPFFPRLGLSLHTGRVGGLQQVCGAVSVAARGCD